MSPYLEKNPSKKSWWGGSRSRPQFKPQYCKNKNKNKILDLNLSSCTRMILK
jgi:hypothetical protein